MTNVVFGQKFRFGLTASPAITWAKPFAAEVNGGKVRMGVDYGLMMDFNFADNYALSTGAMIMLTGGNVKYDPAYLISSIDSNVINAKFRMQYFKLPLTFKLKTNEIGYITYYGTVGVVPGFRIQARASASYGGTELYEDANLIRDNPTVFKALVFQLGLEIGGGIEYSLNGKTSLLVGLVYHNAFINAVNDGDNEKVLLNHVALRTGIFF